MVLADNRYSRFVFWAKLILPLAALGLLSTMFLFSRTFDPGQAIKLSGLDPEKIAREQVLRAPRFAGVADDDSDITISAKTAQPSPDNPRRLMANEIKAVITTVENTRYEIDALDALFDGDTSRLQLTGNVGLKVSTGYILETKELIVDLETAEINAPGMVSGSGPAGELEAGQMSAYRENDAQVLVFKNGVKLIYLPGS